MNSFKRFLCTALAVLMLSTMLPTAAFADSQASDMSGETSDVIWQYTALDDTLYINVKSDKKTGIESYDNPFTYKTEHYLPTLYTDENNNLKFWNGSFSRLVIGNKITALGTAYLGYDIDSKVYTYPELTSVEFENNSNLLIINSYNFYRLPITDISLPQSVSQIGTYAFAGTMLEEIVLSNSMEYVRDGAFSGCKKLRRAVVGGSVRSLGADVFRDCTALESVSLTDTISSIGNNAFSYCTSLSSLNLPSALVSIGDSAFEGSGITSAVFPENLEIISFSAYKNSALEDVTFGSNIRDIRNYAFSGTNLSEITLPSSVTTLGMYAFSNCESLLTADISDIAMSYIPKGAFLGCTALQSIIAENQDSVSSYALSGTTSLNSVVMRKLRSVGDEGFKNSGISEITFAQSTSGSARANLGTSAFEGCKNLVSVKLPKDLYVINTRAFFGCSRLRKITIPQFATSVLQGAFSSTKLSVVTFINANTNINENAFDKIEGAYDRELTFRGYNESTAHAFANENGINFIAFDENEEITDEEEPHIPTDAEIQQNKLNGTWSGGTWKINGALYVYGEGDMKNNIAIDCNGDALTFGELLKNNSNVHEVFIEEGITSVADYFIYVDDVSDSNISTVYLPKSIVTIGKYAFSNTTINRILPNSGAFKKISSTFRYGIFQYNVKQIGEYAFANTPNLNCMVVLPPDLTEVSEGCFYNSAVTGISMYGYVKKIDKKAFANCQSLSSIDIPCSAEIYENENDISQNAVGTMDNGGVRGITVFGRSGSPAQSYAQKYNLVFSESRGNAYAVGSVSTAYKKSLVNYNSKLNWAYYPEDNTLYINKASVQDSSLFNKYYGDKMVAENADTVLQIEENTTFRSLIETGSLSSTALEYIPGTISVDTIVVEEGITELSCSDLFSAFNPKNIVLPESLTTLQYHSFRGCERLESVYIPMSVKSIEDNAFSDSYNLVGVNLGGVTKVDEGMFENRKKLKIVNMNSVKTIGANAFSRCSELQEIVIPNSTTTIGRRAFYKCIKAQAVTIGTGVTSIAENAFDDLAYCERITVNANLPANTTKGAFSDIGTSTLGVDIIFGDGVINADFSAFCNTKVINISLGAGINSVTNTKYLPYAKTVSVSPSNTKYEVIGGGLYTKSGALTYVPAKADSLTIKAGTNAISDYALYNSEIITLTVPETVIAIGNYAFANAKKLKNIEIKRGTQTLGTGAFENCVSLRSFYSPSTIKSLGDACFKGCTRLSSVILPTRLETIGAEAFMNCTSLIGMVISEGVTVIGDRAYMDCTSLEEIYIWYDTTVMNNVFDGDDNLTIYTIAGSDAYRYARENNIPYSAYTDEDIFYDLCGDKLDVYAGYVGLCTDGHGDIEWLTVYSSDCEHDGYMIGVCEYCSEILDERHIVSTGHDYKLSTRIPATATNRGMKVYTCLNCSESYCEYIEALGDETNIETHTVKGSVVIATDKAATKGVSPAKNVSVVIDDMVIAKTDDNGEFELTLESGTYEAKLVYAYGISRTIYIVVEDSDLECGAIPIIGCDFNKDGKIDNDDLALFKMVISSSANDLSYLDYVDMNNDGYINAKDMAYIMTCRGINVSDYAYDEIIIQK